MAWKPGALAKVLRLHALVARHLRGAAFSCPPVFASCPGPHREFTRHSTFMGSGAREVLLDHEDQEHSVLPGAGALPPLLQAEKQRLSSQAISDP